MKIVLHIRRIGMYSGKDKEKVHVGCLGVAAEKPPVSEMVIWATPGTFEVGKYYTADISIFQTASSVS